MISGHQILLKQRLDQLCDGLTSVKTDIVELKESLIFAQNDIDQKFLNTNEKIKSQENKIKSNKRGRWCYINNRTNMGIGNLHNSQLIQWRQVKNKQFANTRY